MKDQYSQDVKIFLDKIQILTIFIKVQFILPEMSVLQWRTKNCEKLRKKYVEPSNKYPGACNWSSAVWQCWKMINDALNYVIVVNQNKFENCPVQAGNPATCANLNKTIILKPILNMDHKLTSTSLRSFFSISITLLNLFIKTSIESWKDSTI